MRDIVENGRAILEYTSGMELADYRRNRLVKDASERYLSRVSEAAVKLGSIAEESFPVQDWRGIRAFGNVLRHDYPDLLDRMIWTMITDRLPSLIVELETFLAKYPEDQETL
ncbi:DUF86 domain-containing protein [Agrobacterium sp. Ap1]|uniref:HepT-like ribonuclease domain-containing protein n=1 Tax=Agrobacterium sp. Ap1 TaxID=2815337 RepID=UPI001A8FC550|nr:HepT-like ribonuclease domain-containing protein [Agrobacterium sp. Ap1]MBO0140482.1 DUF86 domain-containing protein [Agrobacterium sp. Ap1]